MASPSLKKLQKTVDAAPVQRDTRQRAAIRAVVSDSPRPLLPLEIQERAQQHVPGLGLATIYRNLKLLVEEGGVRTVELPGEAPRFESALHGHHHHFQCRMCERVFDVHHCPGNFAEMAPRGFTVDAHELTLYGRCAECSTPARKAARSAKSSLR
ncbi:MAG: transcriptional repressor [Comamonadaceae bacterium]|nr:MAG: transcriptional repressor [Comamonadaceae bacterium]